MQQNASSGRLEGPGERLVVGGTLLYEAVAVVDAHVSGFTQAVDALSGSKDRTTDTNGWGV